MRAWFASCNDGAPDMYGTYNEVFAVDTYRRRPWHSAHRPFSTTEVHFRLKFVVSFSALSFIFSLFLTFWWFLHSALPLVCPGAAPDVP